MTKNESLWTPETGYRQNATPFDLPWRVMGDTTDNAVRLVFNLKSAYFGSNCPKTDSGLTVIITQLTAVRFWIFFRDPIFSRTKTSAWVYEK